MAEKPKVEYDLFLVVFIPLLILITKFIPKLSSLVSTRFYRRTPKEEEQFFQARQIKKEMSTLHMVDEFAKYSKLQRKLNQLSLDLEATNDCRKSLQSKIYMWIVGIFSVIIGVVYLSLLANIGTSTPVFIVPKYWFMPVQSILAYPTGVEGAISIPIWTVLTRNVISLMVKV